MANYKVYIHGRPQGQDCYPLWDTNDKFYIEPFLDMRIGKDFNSVLISDLFQGNAYYTYLINKKVAEYNTRRYNAYFAITIRFDNCYCKKVHILYELLNAVFRKKCIGSLLQDDGDSMQFIVSKLKEKEALLNDISGIIRNNIEQLLSSEISPIKSIQDTMQSVPKYYSLEEVDSPLFVSDMISSKVIVSPDISTSAVRLNNLSSIKTKFDNLQTQYNEKNSENKKLQEERDDLRRKLKENSSENSKAANKIAEQKKEIENLKIDKNIFQTINLNRESIIQFARLVASRFPESFQMDDHRVPSHPKKSTWAFNAKGWLLVGSFILLFAILGLNVYTVCTLHQVGGNKPIQDTTRVADTTQVDSVKPASQVPRPEIRIDIKGYSSGDLIIGKKYHLSVKVDDDSYKGGTFKVTGGTVDKNNDLEVKEKKVVIAYYIDKMELKKRELTAKELSSTTPGNGSHKGGDKGKGDGVSNPGSGMVNNTPSEGEGIGGEK